MRYLLLPVILTSLIINVTYSQSFKKEAFDSLETLTDQRQYERLLDYAETNKLINQFTGDSLAWVQLRISRAHLNRGYYDKSLDIVSSAATNENYSEEISIRLKMLHALALKKNGDYRQALDIFRETLELIPENNYEQRVTTTINYANTHWELGEYKQYAQLTNSALKKAKKEDDIRRQILTRQNITEYYQKITKEWDKVVAHLDTLHQLVGQQGDKRNQAWYRLRQGTYYRDHLEDYNKAISYLKESRNLAESAGRFQIWEQASYELVNAYFKNDQLDQAEELLKEIGNDERLQDIPWAKYKHDARLAQYHLIEGNKSKARPIVERLNSKEEEINNIESLVIGHHAQIMYHIHTNSIAQARQKINAQINTVLDNRSEIEEGEGLAGNILYQYGKAKYSDDNSSPAEIKQQVIDQYIHQDINDWVFEYPERSWAYKIALSIFVGIAGVWVVRKWKARNRSEYVYWRRSIESR